MVLRPAPSEIAVAEWIADRFGAPGPGFAAACVEATGGNPFLLTELLRTLVAEHVGPGAENVERVAAFAPEASRGPCSPGVEAARPDAYRWPELLQSSEGAPTPGCSPR